MKFSAQNQGFRRFLVAALFVSLSVIPVFASAPATAWSGTTNKVAILSGADRSGYCTTNCQYASSVKISASGNKYVAGGFDGVIDIDPSSSTTTLSGNSAAFIAKYDVLGELLWGFALGNNTASSNNPPVMTVDADENVYLAGEFQNTRDFDPSSNVANLTSSGSSDVYILKLNSRGEFVWVKNVGGSSSESQADIQVDANGNVFVAGSFTFTSDFDPGSGTSNLVSNANGDGFLLKLLANGDFAWAKSLSGGLRDSARSISIDSNTNVFVLSWIETGSGTFKSYAYRYSQQGDLDWTIRIGNDTAEDQFANYIRTSPNGEVVVLGSFNGTVDFDSGAGTSTLSASGEDGFLLRLDTAGSFIGAKRFDGPTPSEGGWSFSGLSVDQDSTLRVTGTFATRLNFVPGDGVDELTTSGSSNKDAFFAKLSSTGDLIWARQLAGSSFAQSLGNTTATSGDLVAVGYFAGATDFDISSNAENFTAEGGGDAFILQINSSGSSNLDQLSIPEITSSIAVMAGYNSQITSASESNTYSITSNKGSANLGNFNAGNIPIEIRGLLSGETSTLTVTASRRNFLSNDKSFTGTALRDAEESLTVTTTSGIFGTPLRLSSSGGSGNGVVTYHVSSGNCSVSQETLTSTSAGQCAVIATKASDAVFNGVSSDTTTISIGKATPGLTWSISSRTLGVSPFVIETPTVIGNLDGNFTFVSSDTSVVTVSGNVFTLIAAGAAAVTATFTPADTANYNSAVITETFTANSPPPPPAPAPAPVSTGGGGGVGTTWFNLFISNPDDATLAYAGEACAIFIFKAEEGDKSSPAICASKAGALDYETNDGNYLIRTFDKASPKNFKEYKAKVTFGTFEVTGAGYRGGSVPRRVITVLKPSEYAVEPVVVPSPSPSPSATPSASPSPSPSATPSASPSPSLSATPSAKVANVKFSSLVQKQMAQIGLNVATNASMSVKVTIGNQKKVEASISKPLTLTIPALAKGLKARASVIVNGKAISLGSLGNGDGKPTQLPALSFSKPGTYKVVVTIGQVTKSLSVTVKK